MKIIYEDAQLIVVDKPAGLSVLPDGWEKDPPYLGKMLEDQYGKIFIVHRLDKITSGVMVFARDAESHRVLNIQFENHDAQKTYHAILEGNPKWERKLRSIRCVLMSDTSIAQWWMTKTENLLRHASGSLNGIQSRLWWKRSQ